MSLRRKTNKKIKTIYTEEQVLSFNDLAQKYQKKLDFLLEKDAGIRQVNGVLDDYSEAVEKVFMIDDDNQVHKIVSLGSGKKLSPYVLDLSSVGQLQKKSVDKDWREYKKREKEINQLEKNLKAVKVSKFKKDKKRLLSKGMIKPLGPKADAEERRLEEKFYAEQFITYNPWRIRVIKFYGFFHSLIKALALFLLFVFAVVLLFLVNLQDISRAARLGEEGIYNLDSIKEDLLQRDWRSVEEKLRASGRSFILAHARLQEVNMVSRAIIKLIPPLNRQYLAVNNLLNAAVNLDLAGIRFVELIRKIFTEQGDKGFDLLVKDYLDSLSGVSILVEQGNNYLQKINPLDIAEYSSQLQQLQTYVPLLVQINKQLLVNRESVLDMLGYYHQRRYLVVFQNNKELRPTGGFMGSMALFDVDQGKIKNIEVPGGGLYDYQGGLKQYIIPPKPLQILQNRWFFHDSNWFSDFPSAAKKILWFFEASGGSSVDGLAVVNFTVLEDLLNSLADLNLENDGKQLVNSSLWYELQKAVELDYDKEENKPKQVIGDLLLQLQTQIFSGDSGMKEQFLKVVLKNLWQKEIMLYSNDDGIQSLLESYNFAGKIFDSQNKNYLMLVSTNLGGNKSDGVIEQMVDHQTVVDKNGQITCSLNVKRTNKAKGNEAFLSGDNVSYMQIYVPQGSELLSAYGFSEMPLEKYKNIEDYASKDVDLEMLGAYNWRSSLGMDIHDEFSKTVFSDWVITSPGKSTEFSLIYRLPFTIQDLLLAKGAYAYRLLVQKQSGDIYTNIEHSFVLPENLMIRDAYPIGSQLGLVKKLNGDYQVDFIISEK
jgi:hypothetical protein